MLTTVDRILVAVNDLDNAEHNYSNILGATRIEEYESEYLGAKIRRMTLGASEVELCCPTGAGLTQDRISERGEGLLCGGISTPNINELANHLDQQSIKYVRADDRLYPDANSMYGLPLVISNEPATPRLRGTGPVEFLYELTVVLKSPWKKVAQHYSDTLGINRENEVEITFARFGYEGTLMKFSHDRLDRIELSEAHDPAYPMGRYTAKHGDSLYMCYIQTDDLPSIIKKLEENNCKWTRRTETPIEQDGLWLHPSVTNGVLMGVSRTSLAWGWSGKPEWVKPAP